MLVSENSLLSKNSHKSSFNNDNNSVSYPSSTIVHPKLEMTEPGDADEQEADVAANEVMSGKVFRKFSGGGAGGGVAVSSQMESQLNHLQGGGQAMPDGLRGMMERGFDRDFSQVRLHTDGEAAGLSSSIHAKAFTHGNDIYFNQGQYAPETSEGQRLVAHELAHVAQGGGKVGRASAVPGSELHDRFVSEGSNWILGAGSDAQAQLVKNFYVDQCYPDRKPLTVILFTTQSASGGAFDEEKGTIDFIKNENRTRVLMIQGKSSIRDYADGLISLVNMFGPLQNVIILGHGYFNLVSLGNGVFVSTDSKSDVLYDTIRNLFAEADKEKKEKLSHSFLLPSCLTGAVSDSPNGLANYIQCKMGSDVHVVGNKASVYKDAKSYIRTSNGITCDPDGYLSFVDYDYPSPIHGRTFTPVEEPLDETYHNTNLFGMLFEIKLQLESRENNRSRRKNQPIFLNYPVTGEMKVWYRYNNFRDKVTISGVDILNKIKANIDNDPTGVLSFLNYLLMPMYIPVSVIDPNVDDLFNGAQNKILKWDIYY